MYMQFEDAKEVFLSLLVYWPSRERVDGGAYLEPASLLVQEGERKTKRWNCIAHARIILE